MGKLSISKDESNLEATKPPPACKAFLLCERAIVEANTGKVSLIDLVDALAFDRFPNEIKWLYAALQIAEGVGAYNIHVEFHDVANNEVIAVFADEKLAFTERLMTLFVLFPAVDLSVPHAGKFDVIVFSNGRELERQSS